MLPLPCSAGCSQGKEIKQLIVKSIMAATKK